MAISVDTVYKTVLLILNKEQRGFITPVEFNSLATQVQLEIFEKYFEDFNQQFRSPQNNSEYGNRFDNLDERMSIFKDNVALNFVNLFPNKSYYTSPSSIYYIGDLFFQNETTGKSYIMERVDPGEALLRNNSNYTQPSPINPIYTQQGGYSGGSSPGATKIDVYGPNDNALNLNSVRALCIRKPQDPVWAYEVGSVGQYEYSPIGGPTVIPTTGPVDFDLHVEEQTDVIIQILMYAGVIIRDPQIVQNASQMVQQENINEKS